MPPCRSRAATATPPSADFPNCLFFLPGLAAPPLQARVHFLGTYIRIGIISPDKWEFAGEELCRSTGLSCLGVARRAKTEVPIKCTVISGLKSRAPITININLSAVQLIPHQATARRESVFLLRVAGAVGVQKAQIPTLQSRGQVLIQEIIASFQPHSRHQLAHRHLP